MSLLKFEEHILSLGRIDVCFSRPNDWSHTIKLFDTFLVDSRSQIQDHTTTRYMKLHDFPDGKILKVSRKNNLLYYQIYHDKKYERVRFELELKHRQTKLVQDYLFQNQLAVFEDQLVRQYFNYSGKVLCLDYPYTDWILDFQRRYRLNLTYRSLVINYIENRKIKNQESGRERKIFSSLTIFTFYKKFKCCYF